MLHALVGLLLLSLLAVVSPSAGGHPETAHLTRYVSPATPTMANVSGYVFGLWGPGDNRTPLAGVEVTATEPNRVTVAATTSTNASGGYSMSLPPGPYYLWSNRTGNWGGGGDPDRTNLSAGNRTVNLTAYPYVGYGNATFVLPGWTNLSQYMTGGNYMGRQQPVLSWTQDGAFYVNASDELVFYSFANRSVQAVAPWVPLYEDVMDYAGWENEEFITPDGTLAYGLGCLVSCAGGSDVTLYAVNVSTGRTFEFNWTVPDSALRANAQVNLVGEDGNLSTAILIEDDGATVFHDLWNDSQWAGPTFPFFEANNNYWIPYLSSFVNVEAGGSAGNAIDQWALSGPGDGTTLEKVFSGFYDTGFPTNGVTGPVFNLTSRTLAFDAYSEGGWYTFEYGVSPTNVLQGLTVLDSVAPRASQYSHEELTIDITADEHRASLVADGRAFANTFWPYFDNQSFVVNPFSQVYYETNQTPDVVYNLTNIPNQAFATSDTVDGLFYNTSYLISPDSVACDHTPCPINGGDGDTPGTVWWLWQMGAPEFPFPSSAPLAQTAPPSTVSLTNTTGLSSVELQWTPPVSGQYPLLNYSIVWGLSPGNYTRWASVPSSSHEYTITGLPIGIPVYFGVAAWNLHWHGPFATGQAVPTMGPPAAPSGLKATFVSVNHLTLQWVRPPDTVSNYTVFWGTSCASPMGHMNVDVGTVANLSDLRKHTRYCFIVQAWNSYGGSALSRDLEIDTLGPAPGRQLLPGPSGNFTVPVVGNGGARCAVLCYPMPPDPGVPTFWVAAVAVALGSVLAVRRRPAVGGALIAVGGFLLFL